MQNWEYVVKDMMIGPGVMAPITITVDKDIRLSRFDCPPGTTLTLISVKTVEGEKLPTKVEFDVLRALDIKFLAIIVPANQAIMLVIRNTGKTEQKLDFKLSGHVYE